MMGWGLGSKVCGKGFGVGGVGSKVQGVGRRVWANQASSSSLLLSSLELSDTKAYEP